MRAFGAFRFHFSATWLYATMLVVSNCLWKFGVSRHQLEMRFPERINPNRGAHRFIRCTEGVFFEIGQDALLSPVVSDCLRGEAQKLAGCVESEDVVGVGVPDPDYGFEPESVPL